MLHSERCLCKASTINEVIQVLLSDSDEFIKEIREINKKDYLTNEDIMKVETINAKHRYCLELCKFLNEIMGKYTREA